MSDTKSKITMCITPKTMTLDICKSCQRYTKEETDDTETFFPKKGAFDWKCKERIHIDQGSLFG